MLNLPKYCINDLMGLTHNDFFIMGYFGLVYMGY